MQNTLVNNIFLNYANEEQKAKYLPQLATKGAVTSNRAWIWFHAFALKTKAEDKGDHYVLEGQKGSLQMLKRQKFLLSLPT